MDDAVTFALAEARLRRAFGPLLFAAGTVLLCRSLLTTPTVPHTPEVRQTLVAICAGLVGIALIMVWRAARVRVVITRNEVVLHGVGLTRRVPHAEIAGFEIARRNQVAAPRTLLRLTPGRHRIPRSHIADGVSPATRVAEWQAVATSPGNVAMHALVLDLLRLRPWVNRSAARLDAVVDRMNAALDERRGGPRTADLLAAAQPRLRTARNAD